MLGKIEEMKLITRCVLFDDRNAFGRLVENYQPEIRRFFLNLTLGDVMLSEDLAQETFIKAYLNLQGFKGLASFKTWLFRIGYNEFYNEKRSRREQVADDTERAFDKPTNTAQSIDASIDVQQALKALTENERIVVTLYFINDQPMKKIAEITGMPEGTVKSHISRAREKMERILER